MHEVEDSRLEVEKNGNLRKKKIAGRFKNSETLNKWRLEFEIGIYWKMNKSLHDKFY